MSDFVFDDTVKEVKIASLVLSLDDVYTRAKYEEHKYASERVRIFRAAVCQLYGSVITDTTSSGIVIQGRVEKARNFVEMGQGDMASSEEMMFDLLMAVSSEYVDKDCSAIDIWKEMIARYLIRLHDDFLTTLPAGQERLPQHSQKINRHVKMMKQLLSDIERVFPDWYGQIIEQVHNAFAAGRSRQIDAAAWC